MKEFFKGAMHMTIEEMKEKKREHGYTYNMMSQMSARARTPTRIS